MEGRRERKLVSVLFCDLVGFTARAEALDPEDVAAMLDRYHDQVRAELERYGGTVEKFVGDAVMALFGAPQAHEDDPERAVRAALAIRDWSREREDLDVRLGITTGEALVRLDARPGEAIASGDVVNTSARLQAAAPENTILVDDTTYRATERAIAYAALEPVRAKGKAEPVHVWEALEARSRFGVDAVQTGAPLVGRKRELDRLVDALASARAERTCQLVTLVGVPGIGKSRLVYELSRVADEDNELITWRQGRCLPYGEGVTFWAVGEMVKAEVGVLESDSADEAAGKLRRAVDDLVEPAEEAAWVERNLRPLVGLGGERGLASDRRAEAFAAWRRFFEALAERRPLVLVFEDLHWADGDLLDFVDHLVDWAADVPLLCVCTTRPELHDRRPDWGGGKANAVTVSLAPLADDEVAQLLAALVQRPVAAEHQSALLARADGNPLYAEQFARVVAERGDLDEGAVPETVQGIIAARLDGLAVEEKALLQNAAVLGKVFWLGALAHMGGEDPSALEQRLHALTRREFVRRERRASIAAEREYAFRHLLVRDVAYGQIPRPGRAKKHRRAAEWLETVAPDRSEDRAEMLAYHYLATLELSRAAGLDISDLLEPARIALTEAGDRALALTAMDPARRLYAAALELTPGDHPDRPYSLLRWVRSLSGGVGVDGLEGLREAIPKLLAVGDVEAVAEAEAALANAHWILGDRAAADAHAVRASELVAGIPASPVTLTVLAERSRLLLVAGQSENAVRVAREGLAAAEELRRDDFRAQFLINIGASRTIVGDFAGARDVEQGLSLAIAMKMPGTIHRGYVNLAESYSRQGRLTDAAAMLTAAGRVNEEYGRLTGLQWVLGEETDSRYLTGRWDEALGKARKLLELAEQRVGHYHEPSCLIVMAQIQLARDDVSGALAASARAVELAERRRDPQLLSPVLAMRSRILVEAGVPGAERAVEDALAVPLDFRAALPLAWALVDLGRGDELWAAGLDSIAAPAWAEVAAAVGEGAFVEAADRLAEIGDETDEAYVRLRAAAALAPHRHHEAQAQLARALAFYRSVGATRYLRQGEALLAATA